MQQDYDNLESEFLQYASIVELIEGQEMSIAGVKSTIDIVKTFLDAKDAKSMRAITALDVELSNLETELASKNRELIAKDKEIAQLKEQLAQPRTKTILVKREKYWYTPEDAINPVCSVCHDLHDKITRLVPTDRSTKMMTKHQYQCRNCKTTS